MRHEGPRPGTGTRVGLTGDRRDGLSAWRRWSAADFEVRADPATLPEWMDEACSTTELTRCLRDLERVNRLTLSYRPTIAFLERVVVRQAERELHVVDVGSGYGDMLRVIYGWGRRRGVRLRLTGIDMNAETEGIARSATRAEGIAEDAIEWRTGDAMLDTETHGADVVVSSLVMHHLEDGEIVRFVRWMEASARAGWMINDLERQPLPAWGFGVLARVMRWHEFVRHDGPVSFRRAFRMADWERLLREAGVDAGAAKIAKTFPARMCVERVR